MTGITEQQKLGDFVEQHIHANVSDMVEDLVNVEKLDLFEFFDNPKAEYNGEEYNEKEVDEMINNLNDKIIDVRHLHVTSEDEQDEIQSEIEVLEDEISDLEELDYDIYPEPLEYWIVSDYMAYQLKQRGELIIDQYMSNIWGRETSGQAIFLDGVIIDIARNENII